MCLVSISLSNNRMVGVPQAPGAFKARSKMWDYFIGVQQMSLSARLHMGWPLKAVGALKSLAFKVKRRFFYDRIIPSCREGKRALFADQTFADRHLLTDLNLIIKALWIARKKAS